MAKAICSPGLVPRGADGVGQQLEGRLVRAQVGRKSALVTDGGVELLVLQDLLEVVEGLDAPTERVPEGVGALRHQHELLHVQGVVGVGTAVDHVHQRHRQARSAPTPPR
jgi:hypothetical protein